MSTQLKTMYTPARAIAGLMLLQMILGIALNFYFLKPVLGYDGSVPNDQITQILGVATLVALLISSINLMFGLLLPKQVTTNHNKLFMTLMAFATVGISLCAVEYAQLSEYVSFLIKTANLDEISSNETLAYIKQTLATGRNEAHFYSIFISSVSLLVFYILLFRSALVANALSSFALFAVMLQLIAVGHTFFESSIPNLLQLPLVIAQLAVPIYLLVVGFKDPTSRSSDNLQSVTAQ